MLLLLIFKDKSMFEVLKMPSVYEGKKPVTLG